MSLTRRIVKGSAEAIAWGKRMREIRRAGKKTERAFLGPRGVVAKAEKAKGNPTRKNPLAVFGLGNPPQRINTGIAGVVYNICHEIRAEKTGVKKGLYRHPFSRKSGVQILALDNGDLLIHSTRKVRLWKPF